MFGRRPMVGSTGFDSAPVAQHEPSTVDPARVMKSGPGLGARPESESATFRKKLIYLTCLRRFAELASLWLGHGFDQCRAARSS